MRVIGINASPRKKANTQTLVETVLNGAAEKGAETKLVNLRELQINGCIGCEGCKKHPGVCVQKDDLTVLLQDMTTYDAVVMGTPVYWYHVTAQFKMLVDRLYSFMEIAEDPETGQQTFKSAFPAGKKFVFIISRCFPLKLNSVINARKIKPDELWNYNKNEIYANFNEYDCHK